jgi:hypothetical protein
MEVSTAGGQAHSTTTPEQLAQILSGINAHNQRTKALQGQKADKSAGMYQN